MNKIYFVTVLSIMFITNNVSAQCWINVSVGSQHTLALKNDSSLWATGFNYFGILGDSTNENKNEFGKILNYKWKSISTCDHKNIGLQKDGTIWAWGLNSNGSLGNGTNLLSYPLQIGVDKDWEFISDGAYSTYAIKSNGTLWSWGDNSQGQLGISSLMDSEIPVQIGNDSDWSYVSGGGWHTLALKRNGTLWAWGNNYNGQIGDSTLIDRLEPTKIGKDTNWVSVSTGGNHSLALKSDGTLWSWGISNNGQLGTGVYSISQIVPTQVGIDKDWKSIAGGIFHSVALKKDGTIWTCGSNTYGQLGDGTFLPKCNFTKIQGSNWAFISANSAQTFALKSDGTLWGWGNNHYGELGTKDTVNRNLPFLIQCKNCNSSNANIEKTACDSIKFNDSIYFNSGSYQFNYKNVCGYDSIITLRLKIENCSRCNLFAPNVFSPNNDNRNDFYSVLGLFDQYEITIVNRWGEIVFHGTNQELGWDGKYLSEESPVGAYYFILKYRCRNSHELKILKGDISLIR